MPDYSKNIIYLSKAQYQELVTNGSITVNNETITFNENDIYVTPQAEPVTDVRINGTSAVANGIASVPVANDVNYGVVKVNSNRGIFLHNSGQLSLNYATSNVIKAPTGNLEVLIPYFQHESTFYGLSKVAGVDLANETVTLGTYPETSKTAIRSMLGAVGDVQVNGTSVVTNGVANIPYANENVVGVVKVSPNWGIGIYNGTLLINGASANDVKSGNNSTKAVSAYRQHESTFYGLAKAAGHDEKNSTESVGTYTPEAKGAIQSMLGVSDLIATAENLLVASKAYVIGDVFTANGKLYKVTSAIAANDSIVLQNSGETVSGANAEEIKLSDYVVHDVQVHGTSVMQNGVANVPEATNLVYGAVKLGPGFGHAANGTLTISSASSSQIKAGTNSNNVIKPELQHESTFYGLSKAAGVDLANETVTVGTYPETSKTAIRSMLGAVGDVQVNGTSVVSNGVASIPMAGSDPGVVKINTNYGIWSQNGVIRIVFASDAQIKDGTYLYYPAPVGKMDMATFYGLAKAAGDTTQSASSNAVGTYTDNAKASIKAMLGIQDGSTGTVDVSGATPTITAVENTRYVCGEVTSLSFTPAASGICIVRFTSGSTVTILTLPNTVKFPEWFDPTSLETNTIYEICITDGVYGAVMSWAL